MTLDEHIFNEMLSFESENRLQNNDKYLANNITLRKKLLKKMLNKEQLQAFKDYNFAVVQYYAAKQTEYFTEGFIRGYFTSEDSIPGDD